MQNVKAPAGEWCIGHVFAANDDLEAAAARQADGCRWSGQMQSASSGQWRNGLRHNRVRKSNSLA
ncbi:hypothetical protein X751_17150 [Mesorhizobium sp. LNJC395A00]|nr:hypothetical protein X751_17150 [Mesorhizobium sp. LNJC395A00]